MTMVATPIVAHHSVGAYGAHIISLASLAYALMARASARAAPRG